MTRRTAPAEAGWKTLALFVKEAADAYGADPGRVFIGGFSQGGIMALATMLTAPISVAGAVCMSGRLLPEVLPHAASADALRGMPILIVHGVLDDTLGVHLARGARDRLGSFPIDLTYREFAMGHTTTEDSLAFCSAWLTARLDASTPHASASRPERRSAYGRS